jgi:cathepsin L
MQGFKPQEIDDQATIVPEGGRNLQSYPASLDWRTKGAINPIRNQGSCGGCYAFSALNSLEALYFLKKGSLPQLSEQQLLDCTSSYGNQGCFGGLMTNSYNYLKKFKSMTRESYPYTGKVSSCKYNAANGVVSPTSYINIAKNDP